MKLRGDIRRVDVPRSEIRAYANEEALDALAGLAKIALRETIEINGIPLVSLIAERMGIDEPRSEEAQSRVLGSLYGLSNVLPTAVKLDYVRPNSAYLEDDPAAQAGITAIENS